MQAYLNDIAEGLEKFKGLLSLMEAGSLTSDQRDIERVKRHPTHIRGHQGPQGPCGGRQDAQHGGHGPGPAFGLARSGLALDGFCRGVPAL